jgi:hypothetical protein
VSIRHRVVRALRASLEGWRALNHGPSPFEGRLRRPPQGDGL